jgi:hypothetical protein
MGNRPKAGIQKRWERRRRDQSWWFSSQVSSGLKGSYPSATPTYTYECMEKPLAGEGVDIYILDSGIKLDHNYFSAPGGIGSRATNMFGMGPNEISPYCDETMVSRSLKPSQRSSTSDRESEEEHKKDTDSVAFQDDTTGHGTHVAGIAAGFREGMAPGARIISVKTTCVGGSAASVADGKSTMKIRIPSIYKNGTEPDLAINDIVDKHIENKNKNVGLGPRMHHLCLITLSCRLMSCDVALVNKMNFIWSRRLSDLKCILTVGPGVERLCHQHVLRHGRH